MAPYTLSPGTAATGFEKLLPNRINSNKPKYQEIRCSILRIANSLVAQTRVPRAFSCANRPHFVLRRQHKSLAR
jgi:hypothetical protein